MTVETKDLTAGELIKPSSKITIDYDDEKHRYKLNGEPVPSVTQILDAVLPKPALTWWGFRIGMAATIELMRADKLSLGDVLGGHDDHQRIVDGDPTSEFAVVRGEGSRAKEKTLVEYLAQENQLDPNAVKKLAAGRGTGVHDALNTLGLGGSPDIEAMPEVQRPYCLGLLQWWLDGDEREIKIMEWPVASLTHGYAGRFDLIYEDANGLLVLADLKTSKANRPDSFYRQLMAYKIAWEEMGGRQIDRLEVILCKPDATYAVYDATSKVTEEVWLGAVEAFKANESFKALQRVKK